MLAGMVPGVCVISYDLIRGGGLGAPLLFLLLLYVIIPAVFASISGLLFGGNILNQKKTRNALQAAIRGFCISLVAWLAYVPVLSMFAGRNLNMGFGNRVFLVLLVGSILVGWLIAAVGFITGLLLYRMRKFCPGM
jgi:hypothetical protein